MTKNYESTKHPFEKTTTTMQTSTSLRKARLVRLETSQEGTFGKMFVDGKFVCATGELPRYAGNPDVENERQTDCIPAGTYHCTLRDSPKFGRAYTVKGVPGRSYIMIHKGNWCGEKPKWKSDVEGCILLGEKVGYLSNQKALLSSASAYKRFMEVLGGADFELEIVWE